MVNRLAVQCVETGGVVKTDGDAGSQRECGKENEQVLDLKPVESGQVQEGAAGYIKSEEVIVVGGEERKSFESTVTATCGLPSVSEWR